MDSWVTVEDIAQVVPALQSWGAVPASPKVASLT
jgi:hypothetical protein